MSQSTSNDSKKKSFGQRISMNMKKYWQLHLMLLLPVLYILLFHYAPMYGLQIAFKDYKIRSGIRGSAWVGLAQFKKFLSAYQFKLYLKNTLAISLYSIFVGFPIPIILALLLHVCRAKGLRKICQNVSYIPHFISVVVLVGMMNQILNPLSGLVGIIARAIGVVGTPNDIRANPNAFRSLFVWSGVWQNMGWSTIIYVAALSGVSPELHEAAELDGASRWKRILHVDLPAIMPTIAIMLILRCGSVMSVGYEKVYLMQNPLNLSVSEVISTYVYKVGIGKNQFSYGSAVDLFNSVINAIILIVVNAVARKASHGEQGLF